MESTSTIGVNLRVTAHSNQGGRKYMEDMFCVAYQPTADDKDLLYAYFGIFDGHGGRDAAVYAKHHLMDHIVQQKNFWSDDDELVLKAIRDGFISTHYAMWKELEKWPRTPSGHPSTSGTTASIAFVRKGKLYIGHVGDSGIVLGYEDPETGFWRAKPLTRDHKPESVAENARIIESGGKVLVKSGVPRVVWNRPRVGHKGPVRRSTLIDEIPFLAVARSLGDLWSYNSELNEFVVSPEPDVHVLPIDINSHRCLILGTDGLYNMLTGQDTVNTVYFAEKNNEQQPQFVERDVRSIDDPSVNWINPSKRLVDRALDRWVHYKLRADNTSVVCVVVDPPGPPKVKRSHVIRHSCSTTQDVTSSPVGMSRYCPQEPADIPCVSYNLPVQMGNKVENNNPLLTSPPPPVPTSAIGTPQFESSVSPQVPTKSTSINKSQPSSRTSRVSIPILRRFTRTSRATLGPESAVSHNPSTASPRVGTSAFYPVSAVSLRTLRDSHRNEVLARHENEHTSICTRNSSVNTLDDVQIHEISSSSETSKANVDLKPSNTRKRKGQKLEEAKKKRRVEEVEVRTTRHSVAQKGVLLIPAERVKKVAKRTGRQGNKKTEKCKIVLTEKSDKQKGTYSDTHEGILLIPSERTKKLTPAKKTGRKGNQKTEKIKIVLADKSENYNKKRTDSDSLSQTIDQMPTKRLKQVTPAKKKGQKGTKKTEKKEMIVLENSDNKKVSDSSTQAVSLIPSERLLRTTSAKLNSNSKSLLEDKADNHKRSGVVSKFTRKRPAVPQTKGRIVNKAKNDANERAKEDGRQSRNVKRSSFQNSHVVCQTRINAEGRMERNLRSTTKATIRVTRTVRK